MTCQAEVEGKQCEEMAEEICLSLGYSVSRSHSRVSSFDLLVNGLRVQVKKRTTERDRRPRRHIELKTSARGSDFAYAPGDVDVFVFLLNGVWCVVPASAICRDDGSIGNRVSFQIIYPFRDAWHLLNGGKHITERQLGFDF